MCHLDVILNPIIFFGLLFMFIKNDSSFVFWSSIFFFLIDDLFLNVLVKVFEVGFVLS